jgi:hypothetical protein
MVKKLQATRENRKNAFSRKLNRVARTIAGNFPALDDSP